MMMPGDQDGLEQHRDDADESGTTTWKPPFPSDPKFRAETHRHLELTSPSR